MRHPPTQFFTDAQILERPKVRSAVVNFDPDTVYGSRTGFQEVLLVMAREKNSVSWPGIWLWSWLTWGPTETLSTTLLSFTDCFIHTVTCLGWVPIEPGPCEVQVRQERVRFWCQNVAKG